MPKTKSKRKSAGAKTVKTTEAARQADGQGRPIGRPFPEAVIDDEEQPDIIQLAADDDNAAGNVYNAWQQIMATERGGMPSVADIPRISCVEDDITLHILPQMRAKIWRHDYTNLALLVNSVS